MNTMVDKLIEQLKTLPYELQKRVFEYARSLVTSSQRGVAGKHLLRFAGTIPLSDVQLMRRTIVQDCDRIDANEW
jgi:hypothetical protein